MGPATDKHQAPTHHLQRCLAYYSLRELVPQDENSWEEALLVGGVRGANLMKATVMVSSHASRWSQVRLYCYVD